jgi:hypothetical protein
MDHRRLAAKRVIATSPPHFYETMTNEDGLYQFLGLPAGTYTLSVPGVPEINDRTADVKGGQCTTLNLLP